MWVLIMYVLIALGVAIGIKLNEEEFTQEWVDKGKGGDDFVSKQLVFSFIWPLILLLFVFFAPYFVVLGINKFIDESKKKK